MKVNYRKLLNTAFSRVVLTVIIILIQIALILTTLLVFNSYFVYFYLFGLILSIAVVLYIINTNSNPAYKLAWIIPIMIFPVFGGLLYVLFGKYKLSKKEKVKVTEIENMILPEIKHSYSVIEKLEEENPEAARQAKYLYNVTNIPPYNNNKSVFLPSGQAMFEKIKEELKKAKKFIFLEYFIIDEGEMWDDILEILEQKVKENVDVRIIYDDFGCIATLPKDYVNTLKKKGIKSCIFGKFVPVLNSKFNNRDHRKICVIDGNTAFTGGINLADEYINKKCRFGEWVDSAIMLKGTAVFSFTLMFLSMWDFINHEKDDINLFRPERLKTYEENGYVLPFTDSPLDDELTGETVFLNMIYSAKKSIFITTPYLIIDNEMITALTTAAKCGVDVRIMTPHIPDKKIVFALTRSHYKVLLTSGIKIYEYTPGFVHSKTMTVDDLYGFVGTINMDYRSLFLHYECGVWMYKTSAIADIKKCFLQNQEKSEEITLSWCRNLNLVTRILNVLLKVLAPMM